MKPEITLAQIKIPLVSDMETINFLKFTWKKVVRDIMAMF